jgi:hypothetical protein
MQRLLLYQPDLCCHICQIVSRSDRCQLEPGQIVAKSEQRNPEQVGRCQLTGFQREHISFRTLNT